MDTIKIEVTQEEFFHIREALTEAAYAGHNHVYLNLRNMLTEKYLDKKQNGKTSFRRT